MTIHSILLPGLRFSETAWANISDNIQPDFQFFFRVTPQDPVVAELSSHVILLVLSGNQSDLEPISRGLVKLPVGPRAAEI